MAAAELVRALVQPIIEQHGAELYDLEHESGILRVVVDCEGGIDVDTIGELSRLISDALDREDPIPDSRYLLEVSSPGVERKLRTPEHFQKQLGNVIAVKFRAPIDGVRRMQARLVSADETDIVLLPEEFADEKTATVCVAFADIDSARTVFDWNAGLGDTRKENTPAPSTKKADA